jgi:glycosyltransferase involved in cell wall biosynthesis
MPSSRANILIVSPYWPWRDNTGAPQRSGLFIDALAELGDIDLLAYSDLGDPFDNFPSSSLVRSLKKAMYAGPQTRTRRWLTYVFGAEKAKYLAARRITRRVAKEMASKTAYDLVVYIREWSWALGHRVLPQAAIVNVDDFSDVVLERWVKAGVDDTGADIGPWGRHRFKRRIRTARRLHERVIKAEASRLVVSQIDADRYPDAKATIVPNAYPRGTEKSGCSLEARAKVLSFVGLHHYAPNSDAASWFAEEVLPLIAEEEPDVQFRIVGRGGERLARLAHLPNVRVVGEVQDLGVELGLARVIVVPLRVGGGSRIKILEAMAACVPVVSTSVGAEGIDIENGQHALIADEASDFAQACLKALAHTPQVTAMVAAAESLVHASYSRPRIKSIVRDVAAQHMSVRRIPGGARRH